MMTQVFQTSSINNLLPSATIYFTAAALTTSGHTLFTTRLPRGKSWCRAAQISESLCFLTEQSKYILTVKMLFLFKPKTKMS